MISRIKIRSRSWLILTVTALAVLCSGCPCAFLSKVISDDISVVDKRLIGTWRLEEDGKIETATFSLLSKTRLAVKGWSSREGEGEKAPELSVTTKKIAGQDYLNLVMEKDGEEWNFLIRYQLNGSELTMEIAESEGVEELIAKKGIRAKILKDEVTISDKDMKAFRSHLGSPELIFSHLVKATRVE